jgi:hypothetical protein
MRALCVALLVVVGGAAYGDDEDPNHEEARKLSDLGADALARGDFKIALNDFESAYRIFPSPKLHYNLALAHEGLEDPASAAMEYREFLAQATADVPQATRDYAKQRMAAIEPKVGLLAITGASGQVTVDGKPVAADQDVYVAPGGHEVRSGGAGATVTVRAGERKKVRLLSLTEPPPERHASSGSVLGKWWFWGIVGTAVAGAVVTTVVVTGSSAAIPQGTLNPGNPWIPFEN